MFYHQCIFASIVTLPRTCLYIFCSHQQPHLLALPPLPLTATCIQTTHFIRPSVPTAPQIPLPPVATPYSSPLHYLAPLTSLLEQSVSGANPVTVRDRRNQKGFGTTDLVTCILP